MLNSLGIGQATIAPDDGDLPNFVHIQGGSFQMGSKEGESDETQHDVTLSDYYLAINELTFEEYDAYYDATGTTKLDDESWGRGSRPVINVSWLDAVSYCNWRSEHEGFQKVYTISEKNVTANWNANGYRLPTEAEWEFAARSRGKDEKWSGTSNESDLTNFANFCDKNCEGWWKKEGLDDSYNYTAPVGSYSTNNIGLNDMSGNVQEWCWDWKGDYLTTIQTNPIGPPTGSSHVLRGGSWHSRPSMLRCAKRDGSNPQYKFYNIGFRLARTAR